LPEYLTKAFLLCWLSDTITRTVTANVVRTTTSQWGRAKFDPRHPLTYHRYRDLHRWLVRDTLQVHPAKFLSRS